jgi:hypothetical protein
VVIEPADLPGGGVADKQRVNMLVVEFKGEFCGDPAQDRGGGGRRPRAAP